MSKNKLSKKELMDLVGQRVMLKNPTPTTDTSTKYLVKDVEYFGTWTPSWIRINNNAGKSITLKEERFDL